MKKIIRWVERWLGRQDRLLLIMIISMIFVYISNSETDIMTKNFLSMIVIPTYIYLLQIIMKASITNNDFNINMFLTDKVTDEIIWRTESEGDINKYSYLVIENLCEINIYTCYIKVTTFGNSVKYFIICEDLPKEKQFYIRVPYKSQDIKEVIISCEILGQCRTKSFYGIKSGDNEMTVFAKSDRLENEKMAIKNEKGFEKAETMIRYKV